MSKEEDNENSIKLICHDQQLEENQQSRKSITSVDSVAKNQVPRRLKKTFLCALTLFIIGIILLIVGIEESIRRSEIFNGITFGIISILILIPGGYYTYKFCKAKKTHEIDKRREILDSIPEI